MRALSRFLLGMVVLMVVPGCGKKGDHSIESSVEVGTYEDLGEFFKTYGYTYEAWQAGFRAVPRAYIADVPKRWVETANNISLNLKKKIFYSSILPIVLRANEKIVIERRLMEPITMQIFADQTISKNDRQYLADLAARYLVPTSSGTDDKMWAKELMLRVDEIPPALALAQASYESAYATSRFATLGNALFGQYATEGKRVESQDPGEKGREYQIAAHDTLFDSVSAYAFNLNTNPAYAEFRKVRAQYRANGQAPEATGLAATLLAYSTRREAYTREVARIIRSHRLSRADSAFLREMTPIHIIPKQNPGDAEN